MNVLLPSEIARLVLGYLSSVKCTAAREKFLEECLHLREYVFFLENGQEYPTNISGHDLIHYLNIGFQYTQYITCGETMKFPLPTPASYYGFQNRGFLQATSNGNESPAQSARTTETPMTSPRVNPPVSRTPRGVWLNASPATDRRSPESIIDVTTITEPPSSEPQLPPPKRLAEAAIQTDSILDQEEISSQLEAHDHAMALVISQQQSQELKRNLQQQETLQIASRLQQQEPHQQVLSIDSQMQQQQQQQQLQIESQLHQQQQQQQQQQLRVESHLQKKRLQQQPLQSQQQQQQQLQVHLHMQQRRQIQQQQLPPIESRINQQLQKIQQQTLQRQPQVQRQEEEEEEEEEQQREAQQEQQNLTQQQPQNLIEFQPESPIPNQQQSSVQKQQHQSLDANKPSLHQFATPNVPTPQSATAAFPGAGWSRLQTLRKDESFEISVGFPDAHSSPKRKPVAPKKRSYGSQLESFTSPTNVESNATRKAIDELVQNQLAERIAESINEVTTTFKPLPSTEDSCPSFLNCGSNLPDSLLSDVISKTLSDPVMEELAQYVAIQSNSLDLETPTGTPLKEISLKTPFKQIAEDMARQGPSGTLEFTHPVELNLSLPMEAQSSTTASLVAQQSVAVESNPLGSSAAATADPMKIVVDSTPGRNHSKCSLTLRKLPAPRKPSPKLLSPGSTTASTADLEERAVEIGTPKVSVAAAATSFSISQIKPLPGTHIRALDFGNAGDGSSRPKFSNASDKLRSSRCRKRQSPVASVEPPTKSKRTSARTRCQPNSATDCVSSSPPTPVYSVSDLPSIPTLTDGPSNRFSTERTSVQSFGSSSGIGTKVPIIVSIPDSPLPNSAAVSPRRSKSTSTGTQRRQAILVEAVPSSRKTTPKRVSSSRPKPRTRLNSGGNPSTENSMNYPRVTTDFVMPTTPKKIPTTSVASTRSNARTSRPRDLCEESSRNKPETPAALPTSAVQDRPLVNRASNSDFNIDIAALLDRVHKNR